MGLDMYLTAERYFWQDEEKPAINEIPEGYRLKTITVEAGYWRKANHIHRWFVDNVQRGEDECREHHVERDQLMELLLLCRDVLADPKKGPELLPTQSGFFFGSTEYDEGYLSDLKHTVALLEKCLDESRFPAKNWDFEYRASW